MAFATLDGAIIQEGWIRQPLRGAWLAELVVDARTAPSGVVELVAGGNTFSATVRRAGTFHGSARVQLVGGADGLATQLGGKAYRGVPLRIPLVDVLSGAGETLASTTDAALTGLHLPAWTRTAGPASNALEELLAAAGASYGWRVLADGTVWAGVETWPTSTLAHELLEEAPEEARATIWSAAFDLRPGVTFRDRRVSVVEHRIEPARTRTVVWFT